MSASGFSTILYNFVKKKKDEKEVTRKVHKDQGISSIVMKEKNIEMSKMKVNLS